MKQTVEKDRSPPDRDFVSLEAVPLACSTFTYENRHKIQMEMMQNSIAVLIQKSFFFIDILPLKTTSRRGQRLSIRLEGILMG